MPSLHRPPRLRWLKLGSMVGLSFGKAVALARKPNVIEFGNVITADDGPSCLEAAAHSTP